MEICEIADQTVSRLASASAHAERSYLQQRRTLMMSITRARGAIAQATEPAERERLGRELRDLLQKEEDLKDAWGNCELRRWTGRARAHESGAGAESRVAWTQRPIAPVAKPKAATTTRRLVGYAAIFGREAVIAAAFREQVAAGAFRDVVDTADCRCLVNHNPDLLLGRTASFTLELREDKHGLHFGCNALRNDPLTDGVVERIRRRDLSGCSFAFTVAEDAWEFPTDGLPSRTIMRIGELYDVGPVTYPAYEDTSVSVAEQDRAAEAAEYFRECEEEEFAEIERDHQLEMLQDRIRALEVQRLYDECGRIAAECRKAGV